MGCAGRHVLVVDQPRPLDAVQDDERQAAGHGGEDPAAGLLRSPWFIEWTAMTMVKLLESRQKVMTLEKMMLGKKSNGFGQSGFETRQ